MTKLRTLRRGGIAALVLLLGGMPAHATPVVLPLVGTAWDGNQGSEAVLCVDTTGAYVGCGGGGTSANPTVVSAAGAASAPVNVSTATTTQIVAASGSLVIHVRQWVLVTTLADNITWESADSGGSCANPVALTGAMPFSANGGASVGSGFGDVLVLPAGKALCLLTSAPTQISGSVAYGQL